MNEQVQTLIARINESTATTAALIQELHDLIASGWPAGEQKPIIQFSNGASLATYGNAANLRATIEQAAPTARVL